MAKLLAFGLSSDELAKVKRAAGSLKLRVEAVPPMLLRQSIGVLASRKIESLSESVQMGAETEIFTGTPPQESLLVFCGLEERMLDKLLGALRRNEVQVDYKAVQTPSNQQWSALRLYAELEREKHSLGAARV
ncbi:MAG: DUF3783 domain-containing protein [Lachnospiraceae bacterium]|nr:DUF3783 domain-containing protein [Lachnospiraceae bacterium]